MKLIFKKYWILFLALFCVLFFIINIIIFWPGFYSNDSLLHYEMVADIEQLDDWHPPLYSLIWEFMYDSTHVRASMFILQIGLMWSSIYLLCLYIYINYKNYFASLLPIVFIGFSPYIISINGTLWKDVLIAMFLLFATAISLLSKYINKNVMVYLYIFFVTILYICAGNLRHGLVLMIIPLAILSVLHIYKRWWQRLLYAFCVILLIYTAGLMIDNIFKPIKTNVRASVMLDDIKQLYTNQDIAESNLAPDTKKYINDIKTGCSNKGEIINALWACGIPIEDFRRVTQHDMNNFQQEWIGAILNKPAEYVKFRVRAFNLLINPMYVYAWHPLKVTPNNLNTKIPNNMLTRYAENYYNLSLRDLGFGFRPYFWILVSILGIFAAYYNRKLLRYASSLILIFSSGLIYIFQYLPTTIAWDYRYSYWLTTATITGSTLLIVDYYFKNKKTKK